jgi:hypothetical protein
MEEYDVRLSDGSIMVVRAGSPDEALQIAARRIAEREAAQQPAADGLHHGTALKRQLTFWRVLAVA